ncbi:MAG: hypothetical protein M3Q89_14255 [Verrucomicrobiota bacterium]|nr:hypothetical protein [Verrucomicrobiota bacterium]
MMIKPERVAKAVYIHELEADAINPVPFFVRQTWRSAATRVRLDRGTAG